MKSEKFTYSSNSIAPHHTYAPQSGTTCQDTFYEYDLAGNITKQNEQSPNAGIAGNNTPPSGSPSGTPPGLVRDFEYDPLYRLISASGRESGIYPNGANPWLEAHAGNLPTPGTGNTVADTQGYTRTYKYDRLENPPSADLQYAANAPYRYRK